MNDDELRALVRDAVARHLGAAHPASAAPRSPQEGATAPRVSPAAPAAAAHMSHALYLTLVNPGDACMIEPAVPCNHCGYCKTHGH
jgi:hypothetical protein